ncbi:MAG TPA: GAF domain-containing protein [Terriglobales bacterium]|nr:GAF domain-containing protein [Terriglobales bacterium]
MLDNSAHHRTPELALGALAVSLTLSEPSAELRFPGEDGGHSLATWARRDLAATLQLLAERAQYISGASGAAIGLRNGSQITCQASSGPSAPKIGSHLDVASGLSGESVRTRKTLRCDNTASDPRVDHEACDRLGIASFAVMPIVRGEEVVGIFEIFHRKPHALQSRDLLALERMCEMVNTALDHVSDQRLAPPARSFAVHGNAPTPPAHPANTLPVEPASPELNTVSPTPSESPVAPPPGAEPLKVHTCSQCGFPVSDGRTRCVDCEASSPTTQTPAASEALFSAQLADSGSRNFKHWILANRYIIGMVLISAATIAFALLR